MATGDGLRKFAEQAIKVERVLSEAHIAGSPGRVVYLLSVADRAGGVTQKDVITKLALSKDVVSKLVGALVGAGLLTQIRLASNPRIKRIATTDTGSDLLTRLKGELTVPRPAAAKVGGDSAVYSFLDQFS